MSLENGSWSPRPVADRLLTLLKTRGPQTTTDLGRALGTTPENARQQLGKLATEGLAEASSQPRGVGRPAQIWQLTAAGHARFPDTHAELTVQMLHAVRERLGQQALDVLIESREAATEAAYAAEMAGTTGLRDRVAALASIRDREGYMAEWREEADGALLLIENHCPICAAAAACQDFCRAELAVFQRLVGPDTRIRRMEHIVAGGRRCAYRIEPADAVPG
ncbi:helix-turn-helix transcriptional regulator [Azospirillum picis]|uniref:ArsR family transcriptional regulator n=1 Tax=Azospirillum picis TaxID=488438 RepID=A0ABU0MTD1_9PROT|nr:MarR family transcriptional regulator [Azospirillum picis]MBP2302990.1 putative ArsR family transcriptional regulator [Azospirillum picis]MDQ0536742.1 putative ArsR family transcriptional regulator [Azospirillum picis]